MADVLYLARADVEELLPAFAERLALVEATYRAMAEGLVELPPKPAIHPRPNAFIHAMPAYVGGPFDVAAVKWIAGYRANKVRGLCYLNGIIVVSDPETGIPLACMDGTVITAARTASASAVCARRWAPPSWSTAAIIGFGIQGRSHAAALRSLNPSAAIRVFDPSVDRAARMDGVVAMPSILDAVAGADIVVATAPMVDDPQPSIQEDWLLPRCLVLPVDFDASVQAGIVRGADLFLVDDEGQYAYYRDAGHFEGWPAPHGTVGEWPERSAQSARTVCANLGVGALDATFAEAVVREARRRAVGRLLPL